MYSFLFKETQFPYSNRCFGAFANIKGRPIIKVIRNL